MDRTSFKVKVLGRFRLDDVFVFRSFKNPEETHEEHMAKVELSNLSNWLDTQLGKHEETKDFSVLDCLENVELLEKLNSK